MSYWRCILGHYFKLSVVNDHHLKLRDIDKPFCTVCGSKEVFRSTKDMWMKFTGRCQRQQVTKKKNLRNTYG